MARTTALAVQTLAGLAVTVDVDYAIELATNIVDDIEATGHTCLNDAKLELIERLLAAHFARLNSPTTTSKSIAGASTSWEGNASGFGLELTRYGQQAMMMDCTGTLNDLNDKPQPVEVHWLGTDPDA